MIGIFQSALISLVLLATTLPARAVELVMVHRDGCQYCQRWDEEIAPAYPKTAEGAFAPLRRVELGSEELDAIALDRKVVFTPTFLLVDESGAEMGRLEGYAGEDFFWGLLTRMLERNAGFAAGGGAGG